MAVYRSDADLAFLKNCDNEDLGLLVSILTIDPKDQQFRYGETLTKSEEYETHYPMHDRYWQLIAAELQTYGANTLVTTVRRGKGVLYREILQDVCKRMKVKYRKNISVEQMELNLLFSIIELSLYKMTQSELNTLAKDMEMDLTNPTPEIILMTIQSAIKFSGFAAYRFATTTLAVILKFLGLKAPMSVYILLTQSMKVLSGPVGWAVSTGWLISDIAAPAYRVTIPACVIIAYMRQKSLNSSTTLNEK